MSKSLFYLLFYDGIRWLARFSIYWRRRSFNFNNSSFVFVGAHHYNVDACIAHRVLLLTGYYWFSLPFSYCSRHFQLCGLHSVRVKCVSIAAHFRPKENWFLCSSCSDVFFHENYLHWTQFKCFHWTRFDARVLTQNQQMNRSTLYPKSLEFNFERTWRPKHRVEFQTT